MTEDEFGTLDEFKGLPVYETDNPSCRDLDTIGFSGEYSSVREALDIVEAHDLRHQPDMVPKGAIKNREGGEVAVFVYFHKKRV